MHDLERLALKRIVPFLFFPLFLAACIGPIGDPKTTNTVPVVRIVSPEDGTVVDQTELLGLYAYAWDQEDSAQDLVAGWSSDIDGQLTSGNVDADNFSEVNIGMLSAGTHQITVVVMDTLGDTGEDTLSLVVNGPPSQPQLAFSPQEPRSSDDFSVVFDAPSEDPEGAEVTYTYEWRVDGALFADLSGPTIDSDWTLQGQIWSVSVTPSDGRVDGEPATGEVEVVNATPTAPEIAILPEEFDVEMEDLVCVVLTESVDGDGDDITYTVEWTVDGIEFTETDSTYLPGDTVPAAQLQADQVWACTITPSDDFDDGEAATASLLVEYPDLVLDASTTTLAAGTYAFDDVTLLNASTLFFEGEVTIRSSTFHVGSSSDLNGLGAGEAGGSAGNAGSGTGGGGSGYGAGAGGGGYGGNGGLGGYDSGGSNDTPGTIGSSYGSVDVYEIFMGSGGGQSSYSGGYSGSGAGGGGGAGLLVISESITVDGLIDVSGETGVGGAQCGTGGTSTCTYGGGGGSGGGVLLHGDTVEINGSINARGGPGGVGNDAGGGGGGGRIKVFWNTSLSGNCSQRNCWQVTGGPAGNGTGEIVSAQAGGNGSVQEAQLAWP